jgi:hypothetical protein
MLDTETVFGINSLISFRVSDPDAIQDPAFSNNGSETPFWIQFRIKDPTVVE